jgi:hypothetical protein
MIYEISNKAQIKFSSPHTEFIPKTTQESEFQHSRRLKFEEAKPTSKQRLCIHRCDADESKVQDAGAVENRFLSCFRYNSSFLVRHPNSEDTLNPSLVSQEDEGTDCFDCFANCLDTYLITPIANFCEWILHLFCCSEDSLANSYYLTFENIEQISSALENRTTSQKTFIAILNSALDNPEQFNTFYLKLIENAKKDSVKNVTQLNFLNLFQQAFKETGQQGSGLFFYGLSQNDQYGQLLPGRHYNAKVELYYHINFLHRDAPPGPLSPPCSNPLLAMSRFILFTSKEESYYFPENLKCLLPKMEGYVNSHSHTTLLEMYKELPDYFMNTLRCDPYPLILRFLDELAENPRSIIEQWIYAIREHVDKWKNSKRSFQDYRWVFQIQRKSEGGLRTITINDYLLRELQPAHPLFQILNNPTILANFEEAIRGNRNAIEAVVNSLRSIMEKVPSAIFDRLLNNLLEQTSQEEEKWIELLEVFFLRLTLPDVPANDP